MLSLSNFVLTLFTVEACLTTLALSLSIPPSSGSSSQLSPTSSQLTFRSENKADRKSDRKESIAKAPPSTSATSSSGNVVGTGAPGPSEESENAVLYRLDSDSGAGACILLSVDAIIEFKYSTTLGQRMEKDAFLPSSATVTGDCTGEDQQNMIIKWNKFVLMFFFSKTPGGERWFVEKTELKFDSTDHHMFEHFKNPGRTYTLSSVGSKQLLFPTPVGKSYKCKEVSIDLDSPKQTDTTATLLLRELKLEPFIFKNEFGPEYLCSAGGRGSYRSETAPLIVGSLLAATCLMTITGYALFRYFKIKKVQYDTME